MRARMRWSTLAVLFCGVICAVLSDEEGDIQPTLTIMAKSSVYNARDTKAIFCKAKNIVEPIEWFDKHNRKVAAHSNKNTRVYVEKMTQNKDEFLVPLIIKHAEVTDSGNWTCRAGDFSDYIDIFVGEKVNFTNRNVSMEGEEGKNIKFTCKAVGIPEPTVAWYKDNAPLPIDKEKYNVMPDHTLQIKRLSHMDAGTYVCKVRQRRLSHYTDKTVHLSVQHKPYIYNSQTQELYASKVYKTEEIYAILNETKNITCSAIANPLPTYRWYRRNNSYDDDKNPIVDPETVITAEDGTSSVLVLRMHDKSYVGEYKCSAINPKGQESIVFDVSLGTKPQPPDFAVLASANVTELTFNVSCSQCNVTAKDDVSPDPEHLIVLGYSFELVPFKENFPPDWESAEKISKDTRITDPEDTLFTVDFLANNTAYHVRVRSINAVGYSDWLEISEPAKTINFAASMSAALLLIIATFAFTRCY